MALSLKSWLWPGIELEIKKVLARQDGGPTVLPVEENGFHEDGNRCIFIRSTLAKERVQVIELKKCKGSVTALLSDATTTIKARFSSDAFQFLEKKEQGGVERIIQGGIIQVLEHDIVVSHLPPSDLQVHLNVHNFKFLGIAEPRVLENLTPIQDRESINLFLEELLGFRNCKASPPSASLQNRHSALKTSQPAVDAELAGGQANTQAEFATQAPLRNTKKRRSGNDDNDEVPIFRSQRSKGNDDESLVADRKQYATQRRNKRLRTTAIAIPSEALSNYSDNRVVSNTSGAKTTAHAYSASTVAGLLNLLQKPGSIQVPVAQNAQIGHLTDHQAKTDPILEEDQISKIDNRTGPQVHQPALPEDGGYVQCASDHQRRDENAGAESVLIESSLSDLQTRGAPSAQPSVRPHAKREDGALLRLADSNRIKAVISNPFQGLKRLRYRDVTIAKSQEKLLQRDDCWLPAAPGIRPPVANLPEADLAVFSALVDGPAAQIVNTTKPGPSPATLDVSPESSPTSPQSVQSLELFPSSSAWPPSSPDETSKSLRLPPDTDAEASPTTELPASPWHDDVISEPRDNQAPARLVLLGTSQNKANGAGILGVDQVPAVAHDLLRSISHEGMPMLNGNLEAARNLWDSTSSVTSLHSEAQLPFEEAPASTASLVRLVDDHESNEDSDMEVGVPNALQPSEPSQCPKGMQKTPPISVHQVDRTPYATNRNNAGQEKSGAKDIKGSPIDSKTSQNSVATTWFVNQSLNNITVPGTYTPLSSPTKTPVRSSNAPEEDVVPAKPAAATLGDFTKTTDIVDSNPTIINRKGKVHQLKFEDDPAPKHRRRMKVVTKPIVSYTKGDKSPALDILRNWKREIYAQAKKELLLTLKSSSEESGKASASETDREDDALKLHPSPQAEKAKLRPLLGNLQAKTDISPSKDRGSKATPELDLEPRNSTLWAKDATVSATHSRILTENAETSSIQSPTSTLFSRFRNAYPVYQGTEQQFLAMCRKILALFEDRRLHKLFWDDFVIWQKIEYPKYCHECMERAEDPMSYEEFFYNRVDEPAYTKRIVTPKGLSETLHDVSKDSAAPNRSPRAVQKVVSAEILQSTPIKQRPSLDVACQDETLTPVMDLTQNPSHEIDLTRMYMPKLATKEVDTTSPRSLPWSNVSKHAMGKSDIPLSEPVSPANRTIPASFAPSSLPRKPTAQVKRAPALVGADSRSSRDGPFSKQSKSSSHHIRPASVLERDWWRDPVNPFKVYALADASIRNGRGNGFAQDKSPIFEVTDSDPPTVKDGIVMAKTKRLDVETWEL